MGICRISASSSRAEIVFKVRLVCISSIDSLFSSPLKTCQILVHKLYGDRSLAYGRSNALHRAMPDVACYENTGQTGFEQIRFPVFLPAARQLILHLQVRPGENEAVR